jgi:hypothetical protein
MISAPFRDANAFAVFCELNLNMLFAGFKWVKEWLSRKQVFVVIVVACSIGDGIQGPVYAKHVFWHWVLPSAPRKQVSSV